MSARKRPELGDETTVVLLAQIRELLFALLLALEYDPEITQEVHFTRVGELMGLAHQAYTTADSNGTSK